MNRNLVAKSLPRPLRGAAVIAMLGLFLAACGGVGDNPTATVSPTSTPEATSTHTSAPTDLATSTPTPPATAGTTPVPNQTPTSEGSPEAFPLELLTPRDEAGVEIGAIRVVGNTTSGVAITVNGLQVDVRSDGSFQHDVGLGEGANLVKVIATAPTGETVSREVDVFFTSTAAGLPFTVFYPPDGLATSDPTITVVGGTRPDAVVGVNGTPVDMNAFGIFSSTIPLEEGGNFIEVVATDINGNVRFQTIAVFYLQ